MYSSGGAYQIDVDANDGDSFVQLYFGAAPTDFNDVHTPNEPNLIAEDDDSGGDGSSQIIGFADSGNHVIRVTSWPYWSFGSTPTNTFILRFTGFSLGNSARYSNAIRVDAAGVTTEKNNVVSCTPGKYTFLNGGSTAESAKIDSYVYTLLINGKAVSTLSTDNYKTVASHMFPTIAGNMAGTATLDGASWDLKGMSNYSAQCQVYATQSGGNIQSVTTGTYDSVALAAQAEAAAKAQATKDMITNWATNNEDLAKKYRDARLAGKG